MLTNFKSGNSTDLTEVRHILILPKRDYFVASIVSNDEQFIEIIRDKDVEVVKKYTKQITTKINRLKNKTYKVNEDNITRLIEKEDLFNVYYVSGDVKEIEKFLQEQCSDCDNEKNKNLCLTCKFRVTTDLQYNPSLINVYNLNEFKHEYMKVINTNRKIIEKQNNENTD